MTSEFGDNSVGRFAFSGYADDLLPKLSREAVNIIMRHRKERVHSMCVVLPNRPGTGVAFRKLKRK